jgi:excisionase family DNA binding protein
MSGFGGLIHLHHFGRTREAPHFTGNLVRQRMTRRGKRKESVEGTPKEPFLSRGEVSRLFGVSNSTVTRWARLGLLLVVRTPGGHYRFPAEETLKAAARASAGELSRLD